MSVSKGQPQATTDLVVRSNSATPTPDQWTTPQTYNWHSNLPSASIDVAWSGSLCDRNGQMVTVMGSGFLPNETVLVTITDPWGRTWSQTNPSADGAGDLDEIDTFWKDALCATRNRNDTWTYTVTAAGATSRRQATGTIDLSTAQPPA